MRLPTTVMQPIKVERLVGWAPQFVQSFVSAMHTYRRDQKPWVVEGNNGCQDYGKIPQC